MDSNYWVIIDVSNMAYRAWAVLGSLQHEGAATGVVYGIAQALEALCEDYGTRQLVCCFDAGHDARTHLYPKYKENRKEKRAKETDVEKQGRAQLLRQIDELRTRHLPAVGLQNILHSPGYEADDLMAAACNAIPTRDSGVIMSSDEDLWQCITPRIRCKSPISGKMTTYDSFCKAWPPCKPSDWPTIKAWAGDDGDNIDGIDGVGLKTSWKYITGQLPETHKIYKAFGASHDVYKRNVQLMKLPVAGMPPATLVLQDKPLLWSVLYKAIGAKVRNDKETGRGFGFGGAV